MARTGTWADLARNDRFQFPGAPETGYTVKEVLTGADEGHLISLRVATTYGNADLRTFVLDLPERAQVVITNRPRVVTVPCLRCDEPQRIMFDTALPERPVGVICEPCDDRATADVLAQEEWLRTLRYLAEDRTPDGGEGGSAGEFETAAAGLAHLAAEPSPGRELWAFVEPDGTRRRVPHLVARVRPDGTVWTSPRGRAHLAARNAA